MSEKYKLLCESCTHCEIRLRPEYWRRGEYGYAIKIPAELEYLCHKQNRYINSVLKRCRYFLHRQTQKLEGGKVKSMRFDEIPEQADRVDLATLPKNAELIAISEKYQEAQSGKTAGLVITFMQRDQKTFPQKYSQVSGKDLKVAMKRLKIKDTIELQDFWYQYELTPMRIGYPRYIPIKRLEK